MLDDELGGILCVRGRRRECLQVDLLKTIDTVFFVPFFGQYYGT